VDLSIGAAFTWWAERDPDGTAVRCDDVVLTRAELDRRADALARAWVAGGLAVDDLVTVSLPNGLDFVVACVAAWKAGATPQPLSPDLPAAERAAVLALARPHLVVDGPLPPPSTRGLPPLDPDLAATCWKAPTSSGTTSGPKLVMAAAPARVDPEGRVAAFLPGRAVQLVAGPLTHAAPFAYAMRGLMTGHELVLMPRFEAGEWLRLVAAHRVTWGMLVPTMMHRIWRHPARPAADLSSLESVLHLGARCAPWLKRDWLGWLGPERVVELYAGTESQGLALIGGVDWLAHPGSVGRAVGGSEFRVVSSSGVVLGPGETGEIWMRRDRATYSYRGAEPRVRDGWHTQGDRGRLDPGGWLHVADRVDDVITTGGTSVDPADVEEVLDQHPLVRSVLVVGRPDDDLGEIVHAVVEAPDLDLVELAAWASSRLSPERRPRTWQRSDRALRDDTGKARRRDWK
jgi:bile acid-coenzyme A ligase